MPEFPIVDLSGQRGDPEPPIRPHEFTCDNDSGLCTFTELTGERCEMTQEQHETEGYAQLAADPDFGRRRPFASGKAGNSTAAASDRERIREGARAITKLAPQIMDELLHAIEAVDRALDETAPPEYRDNPLANQWRRLAGGPVMEAAEITEALNLATGGNPRKGVQGSVKYALAEAADTAFASLLAIQSQTKDVSRTWWIFTRAVEKALSRVPGELL